LPARLLWRKEISEDARLALLHLPALFDQQEEDEEEGTDARSLLKEALGHARETYYAMLLMDGDHMGAWVSAGKGKTLAHRETFHPAVRAALDKRFGQDENFSRYARSSRAGNPARHMTISDALNNFALKVVPEVVDRHYGKVLYAGGDDVLAMLPVTHALEAARELRVRYSGAGDDFSKARNGFTRDANGAVLRMMGEKATASAGLVIAHHKAPLQFVLGALRAAEKRAKSAGRDRIAITLIKRSGGTTQLSLRWEELPLLDRTVNALQHSETSRRAAYNVQLWVRDLPDPASLQKTTADGAKRMLSTLLDYQFGRQGMSVQNRQLLADELADYALATDGSKEPADGAKAVADRLTNLLTTAEFLARDTRG
jgi:CRISPR-associated protein Cmr2